MNGRKGGGPHCRVGSPLSGGTWNGYRDIRRLPASARRGPAETVGDRPRGVRAAGWRRRDDADGVRPETGVIPGVRSVRGFLSIGRRSPPPPCRPACPGRSLGAVLSGMVRAGTDRDGFRFSGSVARPFRNGILAPFGPPPPHPVRSVPPGSPAWLHRAAPALCPCAAGAVRGSEGKPWGLSRHPRPGFRVRLCGTDFPAPAPPRR